MPSRIEHESSSEDEDDSLVDALTNMSIQSVFDKTPHRFVPVSRIDELITAKSIMNSLYDNDEETDEEIDEDAEALVEYILQHARRLFAITLLTRFKNTATTRRAMVRFKERNFTDQDLPLEDLPSAGHDQARGCAYVDISSHKLGCMGKLWTQAKIRNFCQEQWRLIAPVFDTDEANHDFTIHTMPFIATNNKASEGSFGFVRRYTIHQAHIRGKDRAEVVAVKEIKRPEKHNTDEDLDKVALHWASEAKALAKMNSLNQEHIVRFITAFRRRLSNYEEHFLVFEWADGGNLRDLWNTIANPKLEPTLLKAAIKQLYGLAEALRAAHNLDDTGASYRHGDLKPANILWFHDGSPLGKLKIGDWGEAKSHNLVTEMRPSKTTAEFGTRRYEPPEVATGLYVHFFGQATRRRSRLYDVWAMGCITLEFIVWLLYGVSKLEAFNKSIREKDSLNSPFYKILNRNLVKVAEVHDEVVRWMDIMATDAACQTQSGEKLALGDLLTVVRQQLLVVKLPQRSGVHNRPHLSGPIRASDLRDLPEPSSIQQDGLVIPFTQEPAEMDATLGADIPSIAVTPVDNDNKGIRTQISAAMSLDTPGSTRATATAFCESLTSIVEKSDVSKYWTIDHTQRPIVITPEPPPSLPSSDDTSSGARFSSGASSSRLRVTTQEKVRF